MIDRLIVCLSPVGDDRVVYCNKSGQVEPSRHCLPECSDGRGQHLRIYVCSTYLTTLIGSCSSSCCCGC